MDIDPRLQDAAQDDPQTYTHNSAQSALYALNPIRLPSPQRHNAGPPSLRQEIDHPYYTAQQESRTQTALPSLPVSQQPEYARSLEPVRDLTDVKNELKRPRACEACRGLKVRCVPEPDGKCKRCAKAGRQCVVTAPSRKRQKKSDSRVAELEKKIDVLTASLQATKNQQINASESDTSEDDCNGGILSSSRPDIQDQHPQGHHGASSWQDPESLVSGTLATQDLSPKRRRTAHHSLQTALGSTGVTNTASL